MRIQSPVAAPLWWDHKSDSGIHFQLPQTSREKLESDIESDIAIVGAGYTGLWTAYWLLKSNPSLSIIILEAKSVGFGASGRNAGWLAGAIDGRPEVLAKKSGVAGVIALYKALKASVDEVLQVLQAEQIDADAIKSGTLQVATSEAQAARLRLSVAGQGDWGATEDDLRMLTVSELGSRIRIRGAVAGAFTPNCARVHPAKLVHGLAASVEKYGGKILENSAVMTIEPHLVSTESGSVRAKFVIQATEGFSSKLPNQSRTILPMNSSMISTEPLPRTVWDQIGWTGAETLTDEAHSYIYLQRSADNRILLGGRGVPYRYANSFDPSGRVPVATTNSLIHMLHKYFPATTDSQITHSWAGILGAPRDFTPGLTFNPRTGMGSAGGYTGQGVLASYLAARTLSDLIIGQDTDRTRLPWVNHSSPRWEPEPLRWLGVRSLYLAYRAADRLETNSQSSRTSWIAHLANKISGR